MSAATRSRTPSKTVASLKQDYAELRDADRALQRGGGRHRAPVKELTEIRDRLAADIDALQKTPQGDLAARVQAFADDKKDSTTASPISNCNFPNWRRCAAMSKDCPANFDRALGWLVGVGEDGNAEERRRTSFPNSSRSTQTRFDEIERTMAHVRRVADEAWRSAIAAGPAGSQGRRGRRPRRPGARTSATGLSPRSTTSKPMKTAISPPG